MKTLLITAASVALIAGSASAATLHVLAGSVNNQASFGDVAGITFSTGSLSGDNLLSSIDLDGRDTGISADLISFEIFIDLDNNAATWDLGASLGSSIESQALAFGTNSFTFNGITLSDNTVYTIVLNNITNATNSVGFGLVNGATDTGTQIFQNDGSGAFHGSHEAALTVHTSAVPEPSSAALLGLGGLALILRRRK